MKTRAIASAPFREIVDRLSLSLDVYQRYVRQVGTLANEGFCEAFFEGTPLTPVRTRWIRSQIFEASYLAVEIEAGDLRALAPTLDAMVLRFDTPFFDGQLPPILLLPAAGQGDVQVSPSVLEHEIVHVNQIVLREMFETPWGPLSADSASRYFTSHARAEFEACFLQFSTWLVEAPEGVGSLKSWCLARGYTEALEQTLLRFCRSPPEDRELHGWLEHLRGQRVFELAAPEVATGDDFSADLDQMVRNAVRRLGDISPDTVRTPGYRWLVSSLGRIGLGPRKAKAVPANPRPATGRRATLPASGALAPRGDLFLEAPIGERPGVYTCPRSS